MGAAQILLKSTAQASEIAGPEWTRTTGIIHVGHIDYLHDGHLHHVKGGKAEEHALALNKTNRAACTPKHACGGHDKTHKHGPNCCHPAVPHGDQVDYLVDGHLHHPHDDHELV